MPRVFYIKHILKEKIVYLTYTANKLLELKEYHVFFSQGEKGI